MWHKQYQDRTIKELGYNSDSECMSAQTVRDNIWILYKDYYFTC